MAQSLRVVTAFGPFAAGQTITDPDQIAAILAAGYSSDVLDASEAAAQARPGTLVLVFGPPSVALGALYDYALDLTSVPNALYKWSGAAWVAIIQAGSGTAPPLTVPGGIAAAPTLSAATSSSLTIVWVAPATGGGPSDYLVQYRKSGTTPWTTLDEGSTGLGATIPGLAALTSYDVQVIATNSAGQGAASPILTVSTPAAAPVLQALGLSLLAATVGVAWTAAITGQTAGSTIVATSSDGTVLTVANGQVSGTFAVVGQPTVTLTETLAGATGSPKSTQLAMTVNAAAAGGGTLDFSDPNNSALAGAL